MDILAAFTFTETAGGTMLAMEFDTRPKGIVSALLPLLSPFIKRDFAKQHAKFKALCEAQAQ